MGVCPGKGQPPIELSLVQEEAVDRSGGRNHSWSVSAFMLGLEENGRKKIAVSVAQNTQLN